MKITWANFLHLYQPPFQDKNLVRLIDKQSYQYIIKFLKKYPNTRITINFAGSLTELLVKNKLEKTIKEFKELAKRGQVEFVSTAKYHPILPFLPEAEIIRQIEINDKINRTYFGSVYQPTGFYCPEMSYSQKVGKAIKKAGYSWTILDDIHNPITTKSRKVYTDKNSGLKLVFRYRPHSKSFPPDIIQEKITKKSAAEEIIITATDGEMYGHNHVDKAKNVEKVLSNTNITTIKMSTALKILPKGREIVPRETSWETSTKELKNNPFPLWDDPKNKIHKLLWQLANKAITANQRYNVNNEHVWARKHLDQGLSSCSWWWASEKKPDIFAPISWSPNEIEKGMNNLIKSIRSLPEVSNSEKISAEALYVNLYQKIWQHHWKKESKKQHIKDD